VNFSCFEAYKSLNYANSTKYEQGPVPVSDFKNIYHLFSGFKTFGYILFKKNEKICHYFVFLPGSGSGLGFLPGSGSGLKCIRIRNTGFGT
jgi:hypothetical protein